MENKVYNYVYQYVKNIRFSGNSKYNMVLANEDFVKKVSNYIASDLCRRGIGYNYIDLYQGEYDNNINGMLKQLLIKHSSVVSNTKPKRHKYRVTNILEDNRIKALILAVFIFTSTAIGLSKKFSSLDKASDEVIYEVANDYEFPNIFSQHNNNYFHTLNASVNFYNNVMGDNSYSDNVEYRFLGIYEAYRSVQQDSLHIMDEMLKAIKSRSYYIDSGSDLYNDVSDYDCFLEFVIDRVYELTGKQVDGIDDVLIEYRNLKNDDTHKGTPYVGLSNNSKRKIDKLMALYIDASEELKENFADVHNDVKEGRSK